MATALRDLSIASRLWIAADYCCPPFVSQVVLEGSGLFDTEHWRKAVAIASAANRGSRLILKGHLKFSHWVDSGETPPVKVIEAHRWDGLSSEGADFLQTSFSPRHGPMAEVLLIKGNPLRVAFRSHHALMDGRGTMTWIEDVFRALRGEDLLGSDVRITENDLLNLTAEKVGKTRPHYYIAPTGRARGSEQGVIWRRKRISGRFSKLLPQLLILTAKEAWRYGTGKVGFGIPVDLRPRRPGMRSTGNLTNALFVEISPVSTVEDIAQEISRKLAERQDGRLNWEEKMISYIPMSLLVRFMKQEAQRSHAAGLYRYSGFVSNIGRFPIESFQGGGFQAHGCWAVPVCLDSLPFSLLLFGVGDNLDLILSMPRVMASEGRLEECFERIAGGLVSEV